ncbi:MAG: DUF2924 domain-containing protein [Burkholderiales bacterium]|nr:DUF2924 domain-containing protein [Burkholderiales bacterium]
MTESIVARVAALRSADFNDLKQMWRDLFQQEPPLFNRRFLESRLAYRIQELALGGLKRDTIKRLDRLGEQLDGGKQSVRSRRIDGRPVAGTRLIRNWEGSDCEVLVGLDYFEYAGQRYKSLSSIARTITGTNRNGWTFFGFSSGRGL